MQPKLYVTNYPAGDFRAMPALGGGHALLKWVTSFPGNPALGLPTVTGLVILSDAETGAVQALFDAGSVTALRTGAAAAIAAETLGVEGYRAAVVGAGVNGRAAARTLRALGRTVALWDVDEARARVDGDGAGGRRDDAGGRARRRRGRHRHSGQGDPAARRRAASGPAREPDGSGRPRQGGDRGRGDPARTDLLRRVGAGEPRRGAGRGGRGRRDRARGRDRPRRGADRRGAKAAASADEITIFDSTGLAIQDLAVAIAAYERRGELELPQLDL